MRLKGKNFQCWENFDLDIDGLTVLVGPSNRGKSAIFRALKGCMRNDIPEDFIRNGQEEPLTLELEVEGNHIEATRKPKGSTKYTINGKKYTSLGGKLPDEVVKLGFGEVKIGEYTVDPIFAGQNKAQFLIDSDRWKPTELSAILGAFSSTEKLDSGKKEANLRITQKKSEASALASEIRSAEERSATLVDLVAEATSVAESIFSLEKGVRENEAKFSQLELAAYHLGRLEPLQKILDSLTLPDLIEIEPLIEKVDNLKIGADSFLTSRFFRKVETSIDEILETWAFVVTSFKQVNGINALLELQDNAGKGSAKVADRLSEILAGVGAQITEAESLTHSIVYLGAVIASTQLRDKIASDLAKNKLELDGVESELEIIRQEVAEETAKKARSGLCSICGKSLEHICQ
jgi:energy-coupling factor transporter ATP-binding protein EcfA2